ncbi:hypothetical protein BpHYR1_017415 [Brachionus plicatilis]|uniref:Uncharacterized protein n=1 Tax=Brachionus plicatilis TaxID=10195 RepID=A0A3M7PJF2_BRAPC|nr:hypothetical protein BpHYR1_017415 [Brachionus plicatilis]
MHANKIENVKSRAEILFLSLNFSNPLINELIHEYYEVFVNSSRSNIKNNMLLGKVWDRFSPIWNLQNGRN